MIYYEIFIDFIEVLLMTYFISHYFDFKNKNQYIIFSTVVLFTISETSRIFDYYGIFLSIISILILILTIYIHKKTLSLDNIYMSIFYFILLSINVIIWLFFKNFITILNIRFFDLTFNKLLQLIETLLLIKFKNKLSLTLDILRWNIMLIFMSILFILLYLLGHIALTKTTVSFSISTFCVVLLLILCIMFMHIVNLVNEENAEKIKLIKEKQQEVFNKQKYYALSKVKDEISDIEHRLFYVVFQIEKYLKDENYQKIEEIIDYYKNDILNHQLIIDTENHVFDVLYSMKINGLIKKGIDINNCIVISRNNFYDDLGFINLLNSVLDYFEDCKVIEISIIEENGYVIVRIIHLDGFVDLDNIVHLLDENKEDLRLMYNYDKFDIKGLRITFDMGMNDYE